MSKNSISAEIFKKYGLPSVFITIIFAGIIWILAHFAAAGGSNVSVLWGLVEYTKKISIPHEVQYKSSQQTKTNENETKPQTVKDTVTITKPLLSVVKPLIKKSQLDDTKFQPISIFTKHNITEKNQNGFLESLRTSRKLRELTAVESGKKVREIPTGTYFFVFGLFLYTYDHDENLLANVLDLVSDRYGSPNNYFEIQHTFDGAYHLIGYINEIQAVDISRLSGGIEKDIIISIRRWDQMTSIASIPIDRIQISKTRYIQVTPELEIKVIDMKVR